MLPETSGHLTRMLADRSRLSFAKLPTDHAQVIDLPRLFEIGKLTSEFDGIYWRWMRLWSNWSLRYFPDKWESTGKKYVSGQNSEFLGRRHPQIQCLRHDFPKQIIRE